MIFFLLISLNLKIIFCHEILFCSNENRSDFNGWTIEMSSNYENDNYSTIYGRLTDLSAENLTNISTYGFSLNFPSKICEKFFNLIEIFSPAVGISKISENSFRNCKNLKILNLNENAIHEIDEKSFANNRKISQILIAKSRLTTLPENLFENLQNLKLLDLSGNFFEFLPSNLFRSLRGIEIIDLHSSRLTILNDEWFKTLNNLETLDLSDNFIEKIPRNSFSAQNNLKILKINRNKIKNLEFLSFRRLEKLKEFYAAENQIKSLDFYVLELPKMLKVVDFVGNECFSGEFDDFGTGKVENLKKFDDCFKEFDKKEFGNFLMDFFRIFN